MDIGEQKMIPREEAKQKLFHFMASGLSMNNYTFEATIDELYDSIGNCSECIKQTGRTCRVFDIGYNSDDPDTFYCGYFRRDEDDQ